MSPSQLLLSANAVQWLACAQITSPFVGGGAVEEQWSPAGRAESNPNIFLVRPVQSFKIFHLGIFSRFPQSLVSYIRLTYTLTLLPSPGR